VGRTSAFHDTGMSGDYYKPEKEDVANGRTASACCVGLLADGCDGFGMRKTT